MPHRGPAPSRGPGARWGCVLPGVLDGRIRGDLGSNCRRECAERHSRASVNRVPNDAGEQRCQNVRSIGWLWCVLLVRQRPRALTPDHRWLESLPGLIPPPLPQNMPHRTASIPTQGQRPGVDDILFGQHGTAQRFAPFRHGREYISSRVPRFPVLFPFVS